MLPPRSRSLRVAFGLSREGYRGAGIQALESSPRLPHRPRKSDSGLEHPDIVSMAGRRRIDRQTRLPTGDASGLRYLWQVARSLHALRVLSRRRVSPPRRAPVRIRDLLQFPLLLTGFPWPPR